jgi:hypothetical protein
MRLPCCLCVCVSLPINFLMSEQIFMKLGMYIMSPEPVSTAYFINPSHQSVCLYVYPPIVTRQRLGKHVPAAMIIRKNRRIIGRVVFCTVRVVLKERLWVCLCINLSLPGNGSVNTFQRQGRILGGVVLYVVRIVWKESRRLVLPRISC